MEAGTAYLKRNCPTCTASDKAVSAVISKIQAESLSLEDVKSYWSGFFKEKTFFSYHRCECGLLYCPEFFTEHQLSHLYASMEDNTAGVSLAPLIKTQKGYFDFLAKHSTLEGSYLEFGPDIGLFTQNCLKQGNFDSYWMCEPNKAVWPALSNVLESKPHHMFADFNNLDSIPDHSVSTVVMIHVLDHLIDPIKSLENIKSKLIPGAILLFVTHDENSLLAKIAKQKWPPYCLQHPQLFNPKSIRELLGTVGFETIACQKTRNYFPMTYLMKHFLYLLGIKNLKLPALNALQLGLKLGNIVTIAKNI